MIFSELCGNRKVIISVPKGEILMGRLFSLIIVLAIAGGGAWMFMHQAQTAGGGAGSPASTADLVGVKRDLMNIARAERSYQAMHTTFGSIADLHSSGELTIDQAGRGPYAYALDSTPTGFRVTATYTGPEGANVPRTISIDETMHISQE